jgi:hypothetical protein
VFDGRGEVAARAHDSGLPLCFMTFDEDGAPAVF